MSTRGQFLRNGERQDQWGTNLRERFGTESGDLRNCQGRTLKIEEFFRVAEGADSAIATGGRRAWATHSWEVKLPNGMTLAFSSFGWPRAWVRFC